MGQNEYNACIASGGSPASCAYLLEGGGAAAESLRNYIWQPFYDVATGFFGILRGSLEGKGKAKRMYFSLVNSQGQRQPINPGSQLLNPATRGMISVGLGFNIAGTGTASEYDLERFGLLGAGGGGGSGAVQFASERALDEAQARLANANAALAELEARGQVPMSDFQRGQLDIQKQQLELQRLQAENDVREFLFGQAAETGRTIMGLKSQERERQTELAGRDPFRFAGTLRGRAVTGRTPFDIFKGQGAEFINSPTPWPNMSMSIPQLESVIQQQQGITAPLGPIGGFAKGGVIDMEKGDDGAFSMRPKMSFLVGEEGPEVLTVGGGKIEVNPLMGTAQGGMEIPDFGGFTELLKYLRGTRGVHQPVGPGDILLRGQAQRLGAFQVAPGSLVKGPGFATVFLVDEMGRLRGLNQAAYGSFRDQPIRELPFAQLGRIPRGPNITQPGFQMPAPNYESYGMRAAPLSTLGGYMDIANIDATDAFTPQVAREYAQQIGFLPSPRLIAREWQYLDPKEQQGLLSMYGMANVSEESFLEEVRRAMPAFRSYATPTNIGGIGTMY